MHGQHDTFSTSRVYCPTTCSCEYITIPSINYSLENWAHCCCTCDVTTLSEIMHHFVYPQIRWRHSGVLMRLSGWLMARVPPAAGMRCEYVRVRVRHERRTSDYDMKDSSQIAQRAVSDGTITAIAYGRTAVISGPRWPRFCWWSASVKGRVCGQRRRRVSLFSDAHTLHWFDWRKIHHTFD